MKAASLPASGLLIVVCGGFLIYQDWDVLTSDIPVFLSNSDNHAIVYNLFEYFFNGLQHGHVRYYQPFLWGGTRLFGDPNFEINIVQLLAGYLYGARGAFQSINYLYVLERLSAFVGFFFLLCTICPQLPKYCAAILGLVFVFSTGFTVASAFPTASLQFSTIPWALYLLSSAAPARFRFVALTLVLFLQFSYGQLQFTVYTGWVLASYAVLAVPSGRKWQSLGTLVGATAIAALLCAYFLSPLLDNLFLANNSGRVSKALDINWQEVPAFFMVRLFVPYLFADGSPLPWWPNWRDGWSPWESFAAFQGTTITLLAFFGLSRRAVPLYFRCTYLFLILAPVTRIGVRLLYLVNLGTAVPYGRVTTLIGVFAPILAAFTLSDLYHNRRAALTFAAWAAAAAVILLVAGSPAVSASYVHFAFNTLRDRFPAAYDSGVADAFFSLHTDDIESAFRMAAGYAALAAMLSVGLGTRHYLSSAGRSEPFAALAVSVLLLVGLVQAVAIYSLQRIQPDEGSLTVDIKHPAEQALLNAGARVAERPVMYRVHPDIYFAEQAHAIEQTRHITGGSAGSNMFRTYANSLAAEGVPVTSGYSSLIPDPKRYSDAIRSTPIASAYERAVGTRVNLHPGMLEAFSIKWVLRHQPQLIGQLHGLPDYTDVWERQFLQNSTLIYQDGSYRLYRYNEARPAIDLPNQIAFGRNAVTALTELEEPDRKWTPTAALQEDDIAKLPESMRAALQRRGDIQVLQQLGSIVETEGEAGEWSSIVVEAPAPAIVLVGVKFDKWWTARVNGKSVPLLRTNNIFAAVVVPAGRSRIEIALHPWSAWIGLAIAAVAWLGFLAWCLWHFAEMQTRKILRMSDVPMVRAGLRTVAAVFLVAVLVWLGDITLNYFGRKTAAAPEVATTSRADLPTECRGLEDRRGQLSAAAPSAGREIVGDGTQPASVQESSHNPQAEAYHLFDASPAYWHVDVKDPLPEEWLVIDLGSPQIIDDLTITPRSDDPAQLFRSACWLGSNDRTNWTGIANLAEPSVSSPGWISWNFGNTPKAFRYFKLLIPNRTHDRTHAFYSIGKMKLSGP